MFDCFGVVLSDVSEIWAKNHGIVGEEYKNWRKVADQNDLGEIGKKELYQQLGNFSGQTSYESEDEWRRILKVNVDVVRVARELRSCGAKVVMLSNTGDFIEGYLEKFGVNDIWDEKFLSYELGMKKPDPEIFQYALDKMGFEPQDAYFIDDREENVEAAKRLGIKGILYPSAEFDELI